MFSPTTDHSLSPFLSLKRTLVLGATTLLHPTLTNAQLVGPGGVVPYGAGGGGRRVSYGVVRDAAKGFFLGGSSIPELNGVYERVSGLPRACAHTGIHYKDGSLTYHSEATGWYMALVDASPPSQNDEYAEDEDGSGAKRKVATATEWILIDNKLQDRFRHEGETILPGSGTSWTHIGADGKRKKSKGGFADIFDDLEFLYPPATEEDNFVDLDEVPWQVIAVMDPDMLHRLKYHKRYHDHTVRRALSGSDLPALGNPSHQGAFVSLESDVPDHLSIWFSMRGMLGEKAVESQAVYAKLQRDKDIADALAKSVSNIRVLIRDGAQYSEASEKLEEFLSSDVLSELPQDQLAPSQWRAGLAWIKANVLKAQSYLLRRVGSLEKAMEKITEALSMFPRWMGGLEEQALVFLDRGEPGKAKHLFEQILRSSRKYPELPGWLLIGHTHDKRQWEAQVEFPEPKFGGLLEDAPEESNFGGKHDENKKRKKLIDNPQQYLREHANYYRLLQVPVDFASPAEEDLLKRQFRQLSKHTHPDKHGNEYKELFQKIAKAYEVLSDRSKRIAYDEGEDLNDLDVQHRVEDENGHRKDTLKEEVDKNYFPEKHGFHPFGDPFERKKSQGWGDTYDGWKKKKDPEQFGDRMAMRYDCPIVVTAEGDASETAGEEGRKSRFVTSSAR
ncbi:unnamed protein product [Amoebophrya sp. A25]|nr:unnamed protein product [Amoebophrya sp. A25]|eukprot:GSA25T00017350001.1